jgi:ElaB/YqjD/DUF883 family membrane-anchored ribosome-binding protein
MGAGTGGINRLDPVDDMEDTIEVDEDEQTIQVARTQIEQTRSDISGTLDAIKDKLQPQTLMQQAKEAVKETVQETTHQAVDSAKAAVTNVVDTAKEKVEGVVDSARDAGSSVMDTVKANPIPYALIGTGLTWLCLNAKRQKATEHYYPTQRYRTREYDYRYQPGYETREWAGTSVGDNLSDLRGSEYRSTAAAGAEYRSAAASGAEYRSTSTTDGGTLHQARERVGEMADSVQERAGQVVDRVQYQARHAAEGIEHTFYRNPLAMGMMALGLGAALGFLIPETYQENRLMGETRDRIVDHAQETVQEKAQEITQKVQTVAQETMDTATQKAKDAGLTS